MLFFEDLKIFYMFLEILWRISEIQVYCSELCRIFRRSEVFALAPARGRLTQMKSNPGVGVKDGKSGYHGWSPL